MMVTIAIIGVIAALGYSNLGRLRPRATLATTAADLSSLLHDARMSAVASGQDVSVLVFPSAVGQTGTRGRIIVYQDGNFDFYSTTATVRFGTYDPLAPVAGSASQVLVTYDLPSGIVIGPTAGLGAAAALPAPLDPVDVTKACAFCDAGSTPRGAIRFDPRGRARFYDAAGQKTATGFATGGAFAISSSEVVGAKGLAVVASTGAVRLINAD
jgi:hypothetical protein